MNLMEAKELKKGSYIMFNNEPHQVTRKEVVVFGTHSHSKLKVYLRPFTGGGEKTATFQHHDFVEALDIMRKSGQVIAKTSAGLQIMDGHSYETLEATADPELLEEINEGDQVTFIDYNNNVRVLEKR